MLMTTDDPAFIKYRSFVDEMAYYLKSIKEEFDAFESNHPSQEEQISYLERRKEDVFRRIDLCFERSWHLVNAAPEKDLDKWRAYYVETLFPYIWKDCEFNTYIRAKPLGYDGDFVMMTYIYDYYDRRYYGHSLHAKLVNNYTCNVDVSKSNIARKNFMKKEVFDCLSARSSAKILSVGSGPARELIELLREGKITSNLDFYCLDFEPKAIAFVQEQLKEIVFDAKKIQIHFIHADLIKLLKGKSAPDVMKDFDLVYISGVCDYLSQRLCKKLASYFFNTLQSGGALIMANMSLTKARHRAYYEFLGDWKMVHRLTDDLVAWAEGIEQPHHYELLDVNGCESYHFIRIERP